MSFDKEQNQQTNRQIKLASRPSGEPTADNFDMTTSAIPIPDDNEMLLRTVYLSLDPYMRGRMSDAKSYADPLEIGDVIMGGKVAFLLTASYPNGAQTILITHLTDRRADRACGSCDHQGFAFLRFTDIRQPHIPCKTWHT